MSPDIYFYILLLLVAFLYASVGHGGASGYLALMAFFAFPPDTMRPVALLLNVFVSLIAFIQYFRSGYFQWKLFWPFALASFPAAYLGGGIHIDESIYKKILAVLLLFSVVKLVGFRFHVNRPLQPQNLVVSLMVGAVIGLFSGMIGIGGGIILSPVILLLHWANMKQTAAVSALFILVNSIAGLAGLYTKGIHFNPEMGMMVAIAFAGGSAGAWLGAVKFDNLLLRRILAVVLVIAAVKLLYV